MELAAVSIDGEVTVPDAGSAGAKIPGPVVLLSPHLPNAGSTVIAAA